MWKLARYGVAAIAIALVAEAVWESPFAFNAFAQAGGSDCASSLVSNEFDRHQYLNLEDGVRVPKPLEVPDPEYPWKAQRRGIQGTIVLAIAINKNGGIDTVKIVQRLNPDMDPAAIDAVMRWRFAPAEKDREAVPFQTLVKVGFHLY